MPLTTSAGSYRPISRKLPDAVADRDHMLNKNTGEAVINKSSRETLYTRCNPFAADKLLKYQFRLLSGVCAEICLPWQLTPCDSRGGVGGWVPWLSERSGACLPDPYSVLLGVCPRR